MYQIAITAVWTVFAGCAALASAKLTNRRIKELKVNKKLKADSEEISSEDKVSDVTEETSLEDKDLDVTEETSLEDKNSDVTEEKTESHDDKEEDTGSKKSNDLVLTEYKPDMGNILMLIAVVILTSVCAYRVTSAANSYVSVLKLALSYTAVLSAAIFDLKTKTIPNFLSLILIVARIGISIYEFVFTDEAIPYMIGSLVGLMVCFLLLSIAGKLSKNGIGAGDIKIISSFAFMCGINTVISVLFFSLISCVLISGILIISKKCSKNDLIPFGPFIYVGCVIVYILLIL